MKVKGWPVFEARQLCQCIQPMKGVNMPRAGRVLILLAGTIVFLFCFGCKVLERIDKLTTQDLNVSVVRDGDYRGRQNNLPVTAKVLVSVRDGRITDIKLLRHTHGPDHGADAIIPRVLAKQSLAVDAISGATYSSKVVLKAIESALKKGM